MPKDEYIWWSVLLISGAIILLCPVYLRGSDQYWYTADAASIAHGFHTGTNNLFPNSFTGNWNAPQRPFVHNRPIIYLVGMADMIIGHTVFSWRLVNTVLLLLTVGCVRKGVEWILRGNVSEGSTVRFGIIAGILYLLLPFNFWLVFQPLSTIADAFFTAFIFLYILPRWLKARGKKQIGWWILLIAVSVLAVFDRKDYLLLLILGVTAWLWGSRQLWSKYLWYVPVLILVVGLVSPLFPGHLITKFPVYRLILESRPGGGNNMVSFLDPHIGNYSLSALVRILIPKAFHNLKIQFLPELKLFPFYYVFNMILLLIIAGIVKGWKRIFNQKIKSYCWLTGGILLSFFVLILVYQNHYRYMVSLLPVMLVVAFCMVAYLYRRYNKQQYRISLVAMLIMGMFLIMNIGLTVSGLKAAGKEQENAVMLGKELNQYVKPGEPLVSEWTGNAQVIGYMHQSAPCLYIDKQFVLDSSKVFDDPKVKWVVTTKNSAVQDALQDRISVTYPLAEGFVLNRISHAAALH